MSRTLRKKQPFRPVHVLEEDQNIEEKFLRGDGFWGCLDQEKVGKRKRTGTWLIGREDAVQKTVHCAFFPKKIGVNRQH